MTKHNLPGDFKPPFQPHPWFSDVDSGDCHGEVRPHRHGFAAIAVFKSYFRVWLGVYPNRYEACEAVVDAHRDDVA